MKTGIFYGSTTGNTARVAETIAKAMGVAAADVHDVSNTAPAKLGDYDMIILGSSTWGSGDLQDDWYDFIAGAEMLALPGKKVAVFGCGDETMSDTFCSAVGTIYDRMAKTGATMVGGFTSAPYDFVHSDAVKNDDGMAVGLLLDEVNRPELTDKRIEQWVKTLG